MMRQTALLPLLLCLLLPHVGSAAVVTLNPGDSIQTAIDAAMAGDVIVLNEGMYAQRIDFVGKDITVRSTAPRNPAVVAATVLNGGGGGSVVRFIGGETNAAQLKGLTITNGAAAYGGGIRCSGASPTITGNIVTGNVATAGGGGIFLQASTAILTQNVIRANLASASGGGIMFSGCTGGLCMANQIVENSALSGAGIYLSGDYPELKRNWIRDNVASSAGGGLYIIGGTDLPVRQNVFRDNTAGDGGGVLITLSSVRFMNNVVVGNTATNDGIGPRAGGALQMEGGDNTIVSNTFDNNSSGIWGQNDDSTVSNCIVTNSAGIGVAGTGATKPQVIYSDLWNNAGGNISGITAGIGCLETDPMYAAPGSGVFVLKSQAGHFTPGGWVNDWTTSPCIDAGPPWLAFSQEPAPNGGRVNMGCEGNVNYASKSISTILVQSVPRDGAAGVNRKVKLILTFQHLVKQDSAEAHFELKRGLNVVAGAFAWPEPNKRMTFTPNAPLVPSALHSIILSSGIKRIDNTTIALSETRTFTTGNQPVVTAIAPTGTNVPRSANVVVDFDVPMGHGTTQAAFSITPGVAGVFSWANGSKRLIFNPSANLAATTQYLVKIAGTARSLAGQQMQFPRSWSFTTAAGGAAAMTASAAPTASGAVQISVNLTAAAEVEVTIMNMAGRAVAALPAQQLESGVSSLLWNGRSATGTKAPAGQYLVKVIGRTADGKTCSALAPLKL